MHNEIHEAINHPLYALRRTHSFPMNIKTKGSTVICFFESEESMFNKVL